MRFYLFQALKALSEIRPELKDLLLEDAESVSATEGEHGNIENGQGGALSLQAAAAAYNEIINERENPKTDTNEELTLEGVNKEVPGLSKASMTSLR